MLTDLGHYTVMTNTVHLLLPIDGDELTTQRMVRIANNKLFTLMMGSMLALRSAAPQHVLHYLGPLHPSRRHFQPSPSLGQTAQVTFRWKDYAHHNKPRTLTLSGEEFLRRFSQHVLPKGFPRIRYFGWLANRRRRHLLPHCRLLLAHKPPAAPPTPVGEPALWQCARCQGPMRLVERLTAVQIIFPQAREVHLLDSS